MNGYLDLYTVYNHLVILKTFTKWCRQRRLMILDPLVDLQVEEPRRRKHPAATLEQVNAILAKAKGSLFAVLTAAAFTGLRIGELQALRPEDVDLKSEWIHIRPREDWNPKTMDSQRSVPIHRRLLAILKATARVGSSRFFTAPRSREFAQGGHWINPRDINEQFQGLARECGFPTGREKLGLTLHSLRRFFKTHCHDSGVPKPMIDAWAGHEDQDDMDFFYYDSQKSREWMEKVPFGEPLEEDLKRLKGAESQESTGREESELNK